MTTARARIIKRDNDRVDVLRNQSHTGEASGRFGKREPAVEHDARRARFDDQRVAAATAT